MTAVSYENFDLLIEPQADAYQARVLYSPDGQTPPVPFSLSFLPKDLKHTATLMRAGRNFRPSQSGFEQEIQTPDPQIFGQQLFTAVFQGDVYTRLMRSLAIVKQQKKGLRLRLRLNDVPLLADLPWEYLCGPTPYDFFCLSVETPVVRYLEVMQPDTPLTVARPLRILVMISDPSDSMPRLNVKQEWEQMQEALAALQTSGWVILERLQAATLAALQQRLRQPAPVHIFHFMGHGTFGITQEATGLLLEDKNGKGQLVSAETLGMLFHDHPTLRLAFLNACEGARVSQTDPFMGITQRLVQKGLPAVIAMQSKVTDKAAIRLAHEFYCSLADGYPVDAALAEARKAIYDTKLVEWGLPVLAMRAPDGCIFELEIPTSHVLNVSGIGRFLVQWRVALSFTIICQILLGLLFFQFKDRFLISTFFYFVVVLLTIPVASGWTKIFSLRSLAIFKHKLFITTCMLTIAWSSCIAYQFINILFLQQFTPDKFGIALAVFGVSPDLKVTQIARGIQNSLYDNIDVNISKPNILEKVELKKIGLIRSSQDAIIEGNRLGAEIVLWGKILNSGNGVEIHFQVLETSLPIDDPVIPRAMPIIDRSLHICIGLDDMEHTLTKLASSQIVGLTTYSLGLYYYLHDLNPKLAAEQFEIALKSLQDAETLSEQLCDDPKANLGLVYYYLGKSYQLQGDYQQSQDMLNRAIELIPLDSAILLGQIYNFGALGQELEKQTAIKLLLKPGASDKVSENFNRALVYEVNENYEAALSEYKIILEDKPESFIALLSAARIFAMLDRLDEADNYYDNAKEYTEGSTLKEAWLLLGKGQLYEKRDEIDEAIYAYTAATELAPNLISPYVYRAKLYEKQAEFDAALLDYTHAVQKGEAISANPSWLYVTFAEFLVRMRNYDGAIEQYFYALRSNGPDPLTEAYLVQVYAQKALEASELARKKFKKPCQKDTIVDIDIEALAFDQKKFEDLGLCGFELALKNSGSAEPIIRDMYGHALYSFGDIDGSIIQFKRSIELNQDVPSAVVTKLNLGQLYESLGEFEDAQVIYESILALDNQVSNDYFQSAQKRLIELNQQVAPKVTPTLLPIMTPKE